VLRAHDQFLAGWTAEQQAWAGLDSAVVARAARELAATHVVLVPTLVLHETLARLEDPVLLRRAELRDVPAEAASVRAVAAVVRRAGWGPGDFAAFRRSRLRQDQFVREFKRAGGVIAAGSGAAGPLLVPGASLHEELALLVRAGLTPVEAITAATRRGAQLVGADSLGTLTRGHLADLVVLHANPAERITATRQIAWVMVRGRVLYPDSLRAGWSAP
jgi:imidazolonepropionase-like amidohydrolase